LPNTSFRIEPGSIQLDAARVAPAGTSRKLKAACRSLIQEGKGRQAGPGPVMPFKRVRVCLLYLFVLSWVVGAAAESQITATNTSSNLTDELRERHHEQLQTIFTFLRKGICKHIYLDMGTNIGITLRKLYEPQYYPDAPFVGVFRDTFGDV
jgi:hypothetical protein